MAQTLRPPPGEAVKPISDELALLKARGFLHRPYRTQWLPFSSPGFEKPQAIPHSRVAAENTGKIIAQNYQTRVSYYKMIPVACHIVNGTKKL